jgi:pimeloyl-ACP methyl ester carboxylesterase
MASAHINGVRIAYDCVGRADAPTVLLIHGHPFDRSMWSPQLAAFARSHCRVVAPDLRGYGESSVVPGKTTLKAFAQDLAALLDAIGTAGRTVVCGLSMGGQIAMEFCRTHPDRIAGVILAATFPQSETEAGRLGRLATAERLLVEGMSTYANELLPKMLSANTIRTRPDLAREVLAMMRRASPIGAAAALRGRAERLDYQEVLRGLTVPALVVVGAEDAFTTRADAELMRDLVADARLLWLEGVGHMPNLEAAEAFNHAVEGLLCSPEASLQCR